MGMVLSYGFLGGEIFPGDGAHSHVAVPQARGHGLLRPVSPEQSRAVFLRSTWLSDLAM